jgi:hypothetical protein
VCNFIGGDPKTTARGNIMDIQQKLLDLNVPFHHSMTADDEGVDFLDMKHSSAGALYLKASKL